MRFPRVRSIISVLLLLVTSSALAQKQDNVWYFGMGLGLDFNGGAPTVLGDGAIAQWEGCAGIADPLTGALLFYTDGVTVWNRLHRPMPAGLGMNGNWTSTQSALIVPAPCNPRKFYLFTADADDDTSSSVGVQYSMVDMDADGGLGDVTVRNVPLLSGATQKLLGVRHANGRDFWVIAHTATDNGFHVYPITSAGVGAAIVARVGVPHAGNPAGYLKASPDGTKLVSVLAGSTVELFDFDPATGAVTNPIVLTSRGDYGASFSPDGRLLYVSFAGGTLYQFDVAASDSATVAASADSVGTGILFALQLAPDGKIYIATMDQYLSVIDRPNVRGLGCGFREIGLTMSTGPGGRLTRQGLPNIIDGGTGRPAAACGPPTARFGASDTVICAGVCISLHDSSTGGPSSWEWSFQGATTAGSTARQPEVVCYSSPGRYDIVLRTSNEAGSSTVSRTIVVLPRSDLRARMSGAVASPGDTIELPVTLDMAGDDATPDSLDLDLVYDPGMLRLLDVRLGSPALDGWRIDSIVTSPETGRWFVRIRPEGVRTVGGEGRLATLRFVPYLGASDSARVSFSFGTPGGLCGGIGSVAVDVRLVGCGVRYRLIEATTAAYALLRIAPNPLAATTTIDFSIGLDGPTTLEILDVDGRPVATLLDEPMGPGAYSVRWNAAVPSGFYWCRLRSGDWNAVRAMMVVR